MKKIMTGLMIGILLVTITACKKDEPKEEEKNKNEIVYHLVELSDDKTTYDKKTINSLGLNYQLTVSNIDKSASLKIDNTIMNLTYDDKEFMDKETEEVFPYTKNNYQIIINYNNEKWVFEEDQ